MSNQRQKVEGWQTMNNRRIAPRREIEPLMISNLCSLNTLSKIAKSGQVVEASSSGLLVTLNRFDLIPQFLRSNLDLSTLLGEKVLIHLPQMELEIVGTITRTRFLGKGHFEIGIDYSSEAPEYWRECLMDLLPTPGEISEN